MLLNRRKNLVEGRNMMSSGSDPFDDGPGGARLGARVGADLRAARERVGWTLPAVSAHLRIRLPFLEAIEEGRIGDLPGNAYAVGFVRTYAQSLGLDPDEIGRRFRAEAAGVNRKTELQFPAPVPERGVPAGAVVLVGVVVAIGAYIGWYRFSGDDRSTTEAVQTVPERLAPLAVAPQAPPPAASDTAAAAPVSTASVAAAGSPTAVAPASSGSIPVPVPVPVTVPMSPAMFGPPAPQMFGPPAPGTQMPGAPGVPAAAGGPAGAPAPNVPMPPGTAGPDGTRIVLRAKAEAWVQVRDKQGHVVLNREMRAGETWPVPAKGQLMLTTGNAPATELIVDGTLAPPFAGDKSVLRDLPLDADMIRDGKLTAQLAPAPTVIGPGQGAMRPAAPKPN